MSFHVPLHPQAGSPRGRRRTRSYAATTRDAGYSSTSAIRDAVESPSRLCPRSSAPMYWGLTPTSLASAPCVSPREVRRSPRYSSSSATKTKSLIGRPSSCAQRANESIRGCDWPRSHCEYVDDATPTRRAISAPLRPMASRRARSCSGAKPRSRRLNERTPQVNTMPLVPTL